MAIYRAYVRQIGAGAVAAGGFITLIKTLPTIVSSFKDSLASLRAGQAGGRPPSAPSGTCPSPWSLVGSLALIVVMALLPFVPGTSVLGKLLLGVLIVVFGFFFVTVASRIVGPDRHLVEPDLGHDHRHPDGHLPDLHRHRLDRATSTSRWPCAWAAWCASPPPTPAPPPRI